MVVGDESAPRLVVISRAELAGLVLPLAAVELVIGHSDSADIVRGDRFVSRRHALVTVNPAGPVTIRNLDSTGGTFVNCERLAGRAHYCRAIRCSSLAAQVRAAYPTAVMSDQVRRRVLPIADTAATAVGVTDFLSQSARARRELNDPGFQCGRSGKGHQGASCEEIYDGEG